MIQAQQKGASPLLGNIRHNWQINEIMDLFSMPFMELVFYAASVHRENFNPQEVQVSTLLSIKTGSCPENCKYCPQSAHYNTGLQKEELLDVQSVVESAVQAKNAGASRFCMGAAWREVNDRDLPKLTKMVEEVKNLGLETCVTLGMATKSQLQTLKNAGLDYYNHNIDTSPDNYENIISTRKFSDRMQTLENISDAGLKTCCGGIVGMGESVKDRAVMLQTIANLPTHPKSVPINLLVKVEGTPLAESEDVDPFDFVRVIAVARIMLPESFVRLSAGRENMSDELQALCFLAGANSIFYGDKLLTTANPETSADQRLFQRLGINVI